MSRASRTQSDIQETRDETACIDITCAVKGYQKCRFSVDVGAECRIVKKIGSKAVNEIVQLLFEYYGNIQNRSHFLPTIIKM